MWPFVMGLSRVVMFAPVFAAVATWTNWTPSGAAGGLVRALLARGSCCRARGGFRFCPLASAAAGAARTSAVLPTIPTRIATAAIKRAYRMGILFPCLGGQLVNILH